MSEARYFQWLILGFKGIVDQLEDFKRDSQQDLGAAQKQLLRQTAARILAVADAKEDAK